MFRLDERLKVYLHRPAVDFRLNINGLAALVQQALGLDPLAACVYVSSNRRRNRVKVLGWNRNGFWLLMKRLEEDALVDLLGDGLQVRVEQRLLVQHFSLQAHRLQQRDHTGLANVLPRVRAPVRRTARA